MADVARFDRFSEIGTSGLRQWAGIIDEEFLSALKGSRGAQAYREMRDTSPVVGSIMLAITATLKQVPIRLEPNDTPEAEFVNECWEDMDMGWQCVLSDALSALIFGWALDEIVYRRRNEREGSRYNDGRIGWRKLALREQTTLDRWEFDESGKLLGMWQMLDSSRVLIPEEKFILFRPFGSSSNPEGRSMFRNAYTPYYYQKRLRELEAIGMARDLTGMPICYAPVTWFGAATGSNEATALSELKKIVTRVHRDEQEGMVLPSIYDDAGNQTLKFELIASPGSRQMDVGRVIERYDKDIALTAMMDLILLGHEGVGSFALSESKKEVTELVLSGIMKSFFDELNRKAIPRLLKLNGMVPEEMPRFVHGDIESPDLGKIGAYVQSLASAGIVIGGQTEIESHLLKLGGMPVESIVQKGEDWAA